MTNKLASHVTGKPTHLCSVHEAAIYRTIDGSYPTEQTHKLIYPGELWKKVSSQCASCNIQTAAVIICSSVLWKFPTCWCFTFCKICDTCLSSDKCSHHCNQVFCLLGCFFFSLRLITTQINFILVLLLSSCYNQLYFSFFFFFLQKRYYWNLLYWNHRCWQSHFTVVIFIRISLLKSQI